MIAVAKAAALAGLAGLFIGGVSTVVVGIKAHAAGREKERALQERVIRSMVDTHRAALDARNAEIDAINERDRLRRMGADHAQERERAANRAALARANDDRQRMRDELAAVAAGRVEAADDSIGACRDRASSLGRVLGEALQASAVCAADAEDLASGLRSLRAAWPEP